ncbi:hypothetical protein J7M23_11035 [Candidatus Sumerlaeota bacterium]|nr:hypothetical protein [Candidatus Sumerlaeota bacterium]
MNNFKPLPMIHKLVEQIFYNLSSRQRDYFTKIIVFLILFGASVSLSRIKRFWL